MLSSMGGKQTNTLKNNLNKISFRTLYSRYLCINFCILYELHLRTNAFICGGLSPFVLLSSMFACFEMGCYILDCVLNISFYGFLSIWIYILGPNFKIILTLPKNSLFLNFFPPIMMKVVVLVHI